MTLESQQVYKIDNKTPKVEKTLFARVNRFDQPIKTWDKMFLRWLNTVFQKMENSRFRCVFVDNYYLLINKKYLTYIKHLKSYATAVAMATMTFQDGGYSGFKVT